MRALNVLLCDKYCVFLWKIYLINLLEVYTMYSDHIQTMFLSTFISPLTRLRFSLLSPCHVQFMLCKCFWQRGVTSLKKTDSPSPSSYHMFPAPLWVLVPTFFPPCWDVIRLGLIENLDLLPLSLWCGLKKCFLELIQHLWILWSFCSLAKSLSLERRVIFLRVKFQNNHFWTMIQLNV